MCITIAFNYRSLYTIWKEMLFWHAIKSLSQHGLDEAPAEIEFLLFSCKTWPLVATIAMIFRESTYQISRSLHSIKANRDYTFFCSKHICHYWIYSLQITMYEIRHVTIKLLTFTIDFAFLCKPTWWNANVGGLSPFPHVLISFERTAFPLDCTTGRHSDSVPY